MQGKECAFGSKNKSTQQFPFCKEHESWKFCLCLCQDAGHPLPSQAGQGLLEERASRADMTEVWDGWQTFTVGDSDSNGLQPTVLPCVGSFVTVSIESMKVTTVSVGQVLVRTLREEKGLPKTSEKEK